MKKKVIIAVLATLGLIVIPAVLYLIAAGLFTLIPVNSSFKNRTDGIPVYLSSNGVHVDIVVPVTTKEQDWRNFVNPFDFSDNASQSEYIAFGWGDRGFYMETPGWSNLKMSIALKALFWKSPTAMHVTYYMAPPKESEKVKKVVIDREQYKILVDYIKKAFVKDEQGKPVLLKNPGDYEGWNDNFYKAKGNYTALYTCNNWTNGALKKAGVKTAVWAPLEPCVLYHRE